jgi:hypothetical protein
MTVLASLSSRQFAPQTRDIPFTIGPNVERLRLTLTRPDWPEGQCVRINVQWDDGSEPGVFETSGGVITDKAGNPTGGTRDLTWECGKPAGRAAGTARIEVLQTLTAAVLVEGF